MESPPGTSAFPAAFDEHLPIESTAVALRTFLTNLRRPQGLVTVGLLVGAQTILAFFGNVGIVLGWALVIGYAFHVLDAAAHGETGVPEPVDYEGPETILLPLGQATLALLPAWGPAVWDWYSSGVDFRLASYSFVPQFEWTAHRRALAAAGMLLVPPLLISTAVARSPVAVFHLPLNARLGWAVRRELPLMLAVLEVGLILVWLGAAASPRGASVVLMRLGAAVFSIVGAFVLGWSVYRHADALGIPRQPRHVHRHGPFAP